MEHRYCRRKPLEVGVRLYNGAEVLADGEMQNISTGGIYVRLDDTRRFPVDRVVEVAFDVPDGDGSCAIRSPAMVVHRNPHGIGLMFLNEDLTFSRILKRIVMELPERPQAPAAARPPGNVVSLHERAGRRRGAPARRVERELETGSVD